MDPQHDAGQFFLDHSMTYLNCTNMSPLLHKVKAAGMDEWQARADSQKKNRSVYGSPLPQSLQFHLVPMAIPPQDSCCHPSFSKTYAAGASALSEQKIHLSFRGSTIRFHRIFIILLNRSTAA